MKKFFKELGLILASILQIVFIFYSIPLMLLDILINILSGNWNNLKTKLIFTIKACRFAFKNILAGKRVSIIHATTIASTDYNILKLTNKIVTDYKENVIHCYAIKQYE